MKDWVHVMSKCTTTARMSTWNLTEWGNRNVRMRLTTLGSELFCSAGISPVVSMYIPANGSK